MSSFAESAAQDQGAAQEGTPTVQPEQAKDQSFSIQAGDRQYNSVDEVKTKIENQDSHINTVESENKSLRDEITELKLQLREAHVVEDVLDRMKPNGQTDQQQAPSLGEDQVVELVNNQLTKQKAQDTASYNHKECTDAVKAAYGDAFLQKLQAKALEFNMSLDDVDEIAQKNPAQFKAMFIPANAAQPSQPANASFKGKERGVNYTDTPQESKVVAPLQLRTTKQRAVNFMAALEEHLQNNQ